MTAPDASTHPRLTLAALLDALADYGRGLNGPARAADPGSATAGSAGGAAYLDHSTSAAAPKPDQLVRSKDGSDAMQA